jgi:hypothetical protein
MFNLSKVCGFFLATEQVVNFISKSFDKSIKLTKIIGAVQLESQFLLPFWQHTQFTVPVVSVSGICFYLLTYFVYIFLSTQKLFILVTQLFCVPMLLVSFQ